MEQLGITVFDVAAIAVAIFGALIGMSAGFAHAVLFIASWVAAGWIAWNYAKLIQPEVQKLVTSTELAYFVSMLALFVGALIILVMLTNAITRTVRGGPLGKPDSIVGAGSGVLCAWVVMGTAYLFYGYLGPRELPPAVKDGATFPLIKEMSGFVEPYLPAGFKTRLQGRGSGDSGSSSVPSPADTPNSTPAPADTPKPPQ